MPVTGPEQPIRQAATRFAEQAAQDAPAGSRFLADDGGRDDTGKQLRPLYLGGQKRNSPTCDYLGRHSGANIG